MKLRVPVSALALFALVLAPALAPPAAAQEGLLLEGRVVDAASGEPLPNV
jgi:hypothetical protein